MGSHDCSDCRPILAGERAVAGQDLTLSREPFVGLNGGLSSTTLGLATRLPLHSRSALLAYPTINGNQRVMVEPRCTETDRFSGSLDRAAYDKQASPDT